MNDASSLETRLCKVDETFLPRETFKTPHRRILFSFHGAGVHGCICCGQSVGVPMPEAL